MITKVKDFIEKHHMIQPGDVVAAGVSGGADSVCLLLMLLEYSRLVKIEIRVVHINHGIRAQAAADADYVSKLCRKYELDFYLFEEDVEKQAQLWQMSEEEAGRRLRYRAFEKVLEDVPEEKGKIAVAHHMNDCAETILFHLMRGTGTKGLLGIRPVRDRVIRPLLCVTRLEIEKFCTDNTIEYCIDHTNLLDTYTRNKIRHHILEYAEENINCNAAAHIVKASQIIGETEEYLDKVVNKACQKLLVRKLDCVEIDTTALSEEDELIQKRVLLRALEELVLYRKDITSLHLEKLLDLCRRNGNRQISLPKGFRASREYHKVIIKKAIKETLPEWKPQKIIPPAQIMLSGIERLEFSVISYDKSKIIPVKTYTKWFDYDRIVKSLMLRTRETGDYIAIRHGLATKTLKQYMIDEKIPREKRAFIPLLAYEHHIIWVIGYRISEAFLVDDNTKNVLQVQYIGGNTKDG